MRRHHAKVLVQASCIASGLSGEWAYDNELRGAPIAPARRGEIMSAYHEVYQAWQNDPEGFWAGAAAEIDWD
ncbi:MAG: acetyl-coenzyme A synthetase N-terminal domain-containing protein, partial [Hyphomicrobiales bacterium]